MTNYLAMLLLLGGLISQTSCRRQVPATNAPRADTVAVQPPAPVSRPDSTVGSRPAGQLPGTLVAPFDFAFLTTKSKLSFKSPQQEVDNASLSIRVQKDSLIWLSVSKLGIEGGRTLITRDSVTVMNRLNREYSVVDFATLSRQFNIPITFDLLQALLVDGLPFPQQPAQVGAGQGDGQLISQQTGSLRVDSYIGRPDRKLKTLTMTESATGNRLQIDYTDFTALASYLFPYSSRLVIDYRSRTDGQPAQTQLTVTHSKVELLTTNPGFPFTIPTTYKRRL
ncbi:hypothetical protein GCM10027578_10920 [Spirosoma luteolum]